MRHNNNNMRTKIIITIFFNKRSAPRTGHSYSGGDGGCPRGRGSSCAPIYNNIYFIHCIYTRISIVVVIVQTIFFGS